MDLKSLSSFTYLNITQFLGALNDNIYKFLIVYFFIDLEGIAYSHRILAASGATFVAPFLLFSQFSGTLADRFSKRNIIIATKLLELGVMICGVLAFTYFSKLGSFAVLFLLATQSALFGPSKYGIIPEIVREENISRANGLMTSFTFLAIIIGTFLASFLLDITGRNFIAASGVCLVFSVIGLATSLRIEYTEPSGSSKKFSWLFLSEIYETLKLAKQQPSLLMAVFGSAYFLFIGAFGQLNMIPFAVQSLHLTDVQGGYLFLMMAIGIGFGALLAGKISGDSVELALVPIAGFGIAFACYFLDFFSDQLIAIIPIVLSMGVLGGIFEVPLDSYIQVASPKNVRGQVVAATNFLSFSGVLFASLLVYLVTAVFGFEADKGFTIVGTMTLFTAFLFTFQFFDYLTRFIGMLLSRLHFTTSVIQQEKLPNGPVVFVCSHHAWNDTLLLLGSQRRRLRFFIEEQKPHHSFMLFLYRFLRVVMVPAIEPIDRNEHCFAKMQSALKKGISVCIFVESGEIEHEVLKLKGSDSLSLFLRDNKIAVVTVRIEKGCSTVGSQLPLPKALKERLRVPASVIFG